ncbi:MAG: hypothetical protein GWP19_12465 [Planctomycetia bacterium]|nr:hypothetical protein [Planctomycetia bacterium]
MVNNLFRYIIVCIVCISVLFAQSRTRSGISLDGSTGLILNPSPETLGVGHLRLGTSRFIAPLNQSLTTTMPLAMTLGLTARAELFYSTSSWSFNSQEKEKNATLGIRIKALNIGNNITSIDFRWQNIELFSNNQLSLEGQRIISRVITNFSIFNLKTYTNIGYISTLESTNSKIDNRFIGGVGIQFPVIQHVQGLVDFQVDERINNNGVIGAIGIKWFLFKHIQVATWFNTDIKKGDRITGVFLNLFFSSEVMTGPRRRIRTKKGLPIPPPLSKDFLTTIIVTEKSMNNVEKQKPKYPLNVYVKNYLDKESRNDLPMIPPINQLELWQREVLSELELRKKIIPVIKEKELPYPPPLDTIGFSRDQKPIIKNKLKVNNIQDNELISLPKPPPLESLNP